MSNYGLVVGDGALEEERGNGEAALTVEVVVGRPKGCAFTLGAGRSRGRWCVAYCPA